ncbi:MAG: hypothetical protein WCQ64_14760 [Acidobacteriota bacterium]
MKLPSSRKALPDELEDLKLASDRRLASVGLMLMLVPAVWFVRSDFALYAHDWPRLRERLISRAFLVAVPLAGLILLRAVRSRSSYERTIAGTAWAMAVCVFTLAVLRPAGSGMPLRGPFLNMAVMYFLLPNSRWRQLLPPLALAGAMIVLRSTRLTGGGIDIEGDVVALLVMSAVGVLAVLRRLELEASTYAAVSELKTLEGIIPICSHCRKLRTEVGDWQQLEQYLRHRSDAMLSHGICPDCLVELYKNENLRR